MQTMSRHEQHPLANNNIADVPHCCFSLTLCMTMTMIVYVSGHQTCESSTKPS
jgi:hypothetical protein